jgi:hypothetical protein
MVQMCTFVVAESRTRNEVVPKKRGEAMDCMWVTECATCAKV